jgi:hypothetical protein
MLIIPSVRILLRLRLDNPDNSDNRGDNPTPVSSGKEAEYVAFSCLVICLLGLESTFGRSIDNSTTTCESTSVNRAVPALLTLVPTDNRLQVATPVASVNRFEGDDEENRGRERGTRTDGQIAVILCISPLSSL